uniref:Uncharacterized protein n=1 Tax=Rhizophora mucronata TaxID=61149 RepID=A0A2P2QQJ9_RHIMU
MILLMGAGKTEPKLPMESTLHRSMLHALLMLRETTNSVV